MKKLVVKLVIMVLFSGLSVCMYADFSQQEKADAQAERKDEQQRQAEIKAADSEDKDITAEEEKVKQEADIVSKDAVKEPDDAYEALQKEIGDESDVESMSLQEFLDETKWDENK